MVINAYGDASTAHLSGVEGHHTKMVSSMISRPLLGMLGYSLGSQQSVSKARKSTRGILTAGKPSQGLPAFTHDPGPIHLVAACSIYSIVTHSFYHLHKGDRYQLGIVVCGALSAFVVGWVLGEDVHGVLTGLGPWFILVSLALSAALHKLLDRDSQVGLAM